MTEICWKAQLLCGSTYPYTGHNLSSIATHHHLQVETIEYLYGFQLSLSCDSKFGSVFTKQSLTFLSKISKLMNLSKPHTCEKIV